MTENVQRCWLSLTSAIVLMLASPTIIAQSSGFVEQKGQFRGTDGKVNPLVQFVSPQGPVRMQLRSTGFSYELWEAAGDTRPTVPISQRQAHPESFHIHRVDIDIVGASMSSKGIGSRPHNDAINFFSSDGGSIIDIRTYEEVHYPNVLSGINLTYSISPGKANDPKYQFTLAPGTSIEDIKLSIVGADSIAIEGDELILHTPLGPIIDHIPASWTTNGSSHRPINVVWHQFSDGTIGFSTHSTILENETTIIDPSPAFAWGTYYGGSGVEEAYRIESGAGGEVYTAGTTSSNMFIASGGGYDQTFNGGTDVYLVRLNGYTGARQWGTYYGGIGGEQAWGLVYQDANAIYIPTAENSDAGLLKFNDQGLLLWSETLSGSSQERSHGVAVDAMGNAYLCGQTYSIDFPTTAGAHATTHSGNLDGFIAKYDASGNLLYSSFIGGPVDDAPYSIAATATGEFAITGITGSTSGISTPGTYIPNPQGGTDAFAMKFFSSGIQEWGTYIGTADDETAYRIRPSSIGSFIIVGSTGLVDPLGMTSIGSATSGHDPFCMELDPTGNLNWGKVYRTNGSEYAQDIALNSLGEMTMVGYGYQGIPDPFPSGSTVTCGNSTETFVYRLSQTDGAFVASDCVGGAGHQFGTGVSYFTDQEIFLSGTTDGYLNDIPPGSGSQQTTMQGGPWDAFIMKFVEPTALPMELTSFSVTNNGPVVHVDWTTATEQNVDHFLIERSQSALDGFSTVGSVIAEGNTAISTTYQWIDQAPLLGLAFYRLRAVDSDGSSDIGPTRSVDRSSLSEELLPFPNPTSSDFALNLGSIDIGSLELIDPLGKTIRSWQLPASNSFSVEQIPPGMYLLRHQIDGQTRISRLLVDL